MRYCKDCKWYAAVDHGPGTSETRACTYGCRQSRDPVTGDIYYVDEVNNARTMRYNPDLCGKVARYYTRKWWKFWAPR